jgi:V/A-type H+-transporting ATPase subunit I
MAIASMKKMTLIALKKDRNGILKALQRTGAVHLIEGQTDENLALSANEQSAKIEARLQEVRSALDFLNRYDKSKKPLLAAKPGISADNLNAFIENEEKAAALIENVKSIEERLVSVRAAKLRIANRIAALKPYVKFDAPFEAVGETENTRSFLGVINSSAQNVLTEITDKYEDRVYIETLDNVMEYTSVFVAARKNIAAAVLNDLKSAYFSEFSFGEYTGTPASAIEGLEKEAAEADRAAEKAEEEAGKLAGEKEILTGLDDYFSVELDRANAVSLLSETDKTFLMEGWLIEGTEKKAEEAVSNLTDKYYVDFRDPYDDEQYPVALLNKKLFKPYEAVVEMYSFPDPRGVDATPLIAPFFFIFYGMMVSDAGYGIVLSLFALFLLKVQKPTGMFGKIVRILVMTGISTLFWGSMYGGWFGFSLPPLLFDPMKEPMKMLILCLALGFIHVFTGLLIGAVVAFKRGKWVDAICDKIFWMMLITGLPMLAFGGVLSTVGTYLSIIGAAGIVLTNGRSKKGVIKKLTGGLGSLYGVSGYLSDVLSYCRLFGMGLATGVIAMVFNTIAGLLAGSVIGWIFAAAIFMAGHTFNIGINALGAYVHSSRLMYIEYFSKFYEDGGKPFKPLALRIKHYRLEH